VTGFVFLLLVFIIWYFVFYKDDKKKELKAKIEDDDRQRRQYEYAKKLINDKEYIRKIFEEEFFIVNSKHEDYKKFIDFRNKLQYPDKLIETYEGPSFIDKNQSDPFKKTSCKTLWALGKDNNLIALRESIVALETSPDAYYHGKPEMHGGKVRVQFALTGGKGVRIVHNHLLVGNEKLINQYEFSELTNLDGMKVPSHVMSIVNQHINNLERNRK
jgi:hypothetical protein